MQLYPFKFKSILKERIWGGNKLKTQLNKCFDLKNIGESWEISDVNDNVSIVSNGNLSGTSLKDLLKKYSSDLVGNKNYERFKNTFPLLIKFIDAREDLSIQLHPNDALAKERHNSFGKTEMWHVMQADIDSNLIVGFNQNITKEKYQEHINQKTLPEILNYDKVKKGDTYFIEAGRIHAIGAGVLLAEIQQTSDVTYRVYDWERVDANGKGRELHTDLALDAINFNMKDDFKVDYNKAKNVSNAMVQCPYFTTNYLTIDSKISKTNDLDSFIIYICVGGDAEIITPDYSESIKIGETVLLPASIKTYDIVSKHSELLEVYV